MLRRVSLLLLLCFVTTLHAETRRPVSVVFKLRSTTTLAAVSGKLATLGRTRPIFANLAAKTVQSVAASDLSRIYLLALTSGASVDEAVTALAADPGIEYAEPNYIYHIDQAPASNDSLYDRLWWLRNIHAPEAWEETTGDTSIHIGFIDTGVRWDHVDLVHQFAVNRAEDINHNGLFDPWPSTEQHRDARGTLVTGDLDGIDEDGNGYADDVIGYDFVDQDVTNFGDWSGRDAIPQDENGHGTFVAGILAAERDNRAGIAGVAPGCRLVALRAFDATGNAEDDDVASAIVYAANNGVRVLNMSFGDIYPSLLQRDALRYARKLGVVIFASSGNAGGDAPHYPSDFDEVISVGATTNYPTVDLVWGQTTHGEAMDFVAPGDDIWTTRIDGAYQAVAGTSTSSPIAAGSAALLLSKRPQLSADEVRGILASTAQDLDPAGYDHYSAHGRIDVQRALDFPGSANATISSLHTMDAIAASDNPIVLRGTAISTLFSRYELSIAPTDNPERNFAPSDTLWKPIATSDNQVIDSTLGVWRAAGLAPGLYTVRLAIYTSDRRTVEDRRVIRIKTSAPVLRWATADPIFIHEQRGLLVQAQADVPTRLRAALSPRLAKQDDKLGVEHALLFTREDLGSATALTITLALTDEAGGTADTTLALTVQNEAISERGFTRKPYALPPGYALDTVLSTPAGDLVAESIFPDGVNFGQTKIFAFDGTRFHQTDSTGAIWIPRAIGSTRSDRVPELLEQVLDTTILYRQNASHPLLGDRVFAKRGFWGGALADLDGDGKHEIVGYNDTLVRVTRVIEGQTIRYDSSFSRYVAYTWNGNAYQVLGTMPNPSQPDAYNPFNRFGEPNAAHADLDGDGAEELVTMDNDADLAVFKRDASAPNGFRVVFQQQNDGESEGSLVTTSDFDGDGRQDIAYATHTLLSEDTLREYPAAYWTLTVLRNKGGFVFDTILHDHFAYAHPLAPYHSSVRAMPSVSGRGVTDLGASLFPDFFLLEYNSRTRAMQPIWHYPLSLTARGAIAYDFDRNGKREFGFVAGDSIRFFERDDDYIDRTPSPSGLIVSPRDIDRVDIAWSPIADTTGMNAPLYYILRAAPGDPYRVIDSTRSPFYVDRDVADQDEWYYAIQASDESYSIPLSLPSFAQYAFVHPTPRILRVIGSTSSLSLATSIALRARTLTGTEFSIDDSVAAHTAVIATDTTIVLTATLAPGTHTLRVASLALRDFYNSPFDTTTLYTFDVQPDTARPHFYVVRWQFATTNGVTTAHLTFNTPPSDEALNPAHYTLTPYGSVQRVYRDPADPNALYVELSSNVRFLALDVPFVLCVSDIDDARRVPLEASEANCAGISFAEQDLSNVFVYPNPGKASDGRVTFARLTPVADIRIYSLAMRPIRHLRTTERQGGVEWDLRDEEGRTVGSGEYLFLVTGTNDAGRTVESKLQKFVIVRDE